MLLNAGAKPTATYVALPIDLREDWPTALRSNGFQEQLPTGWSIEGLLPYLPPDAQTAVFEHIAALSALGSSLVVDAYRPEFYGEDALRASFDQMDKAARSEPSADDRIYSQEMFFTGERADVAEMVDRTRLDRDLGAIRRRDGPLRAAGRAQRRRHLAGERLRDGQTTRLRRWAVRRCPCVARR